MLDRERPQIIAAGYMHALKLDLLLDRDGRRSLYFIKSPFHLDEALPLWKLVHDQYHVDAAGLEEPPAHFEPMLPRGAQFAQRLAGLEEGSGLSRSDRVRPAVRDGLAAITRLEESAPSGNPVQLSEVSLAIARLNAATPNPTPEEQLLLETQEASCALLMASADQPLPDPVGLSRVITTLERLSVSPLWRSREWDPARLEIFVYLSSAYQLSGLSLRIPNGLVAELSRAAAALDTAIAVDRHTGGHTAEILQAQRQELARQLGAAQELRDVIHAAALIRGGHTREASDRLTALLRQPLGGYLRTSVTPLLQTQLGDHETLARFLVETDPALVDVLLTNQTNWPVWLDSVRAIFGLLGSAQRPVAEALAQRLLRWEAPQPWAREALAAIPDGALPQRVRQRLLAARPAPPAPQTRSLGALLTHQGLLGRLEGPVALERSQNTVVVGDHDLAYPVIKQAQVHGALPRAGLVVVNWDWTDHDDGASLESITAFNHTLQDDPTAFETFTQLADSSNPQAGWAIRDRWLATDNFLKGLACDGSAAVLIHVVPPGVAATGFRTVRARGRRVWICRAMASQLPRLLRQFRARGRLVEMVDLDHFLRDPGLSAEHPGAMDAFRDTQRVLAGERLSPSLRIIALSAPVYVPVEAVPSLLSRVVRSVAPVADGPPARQGSVEVNPAAGLEEPPAVFMAPNPDTYHGPVRVVMKIGGTWTAAQGVTDEGFVGERSVGPTLSKKPEEATVVQGFVDVIAPVVERYGPNQVESVALAAPGWFDRRMIQVVPQEHIVGLQRIGFSFEQAIGDELARRYAGRRDARLGPIRVRVVHDGTASGMLEVGPLGTFPKAERLLVVDVGTGIATRMMIDGQPFLGGEKVQDFHNEGPNLLMFTGDPDHPNYEYVAVRTHGLPPATVGATLPSGRPNPWLGVETLEQRTSGPGVARYAAQLAREPRRGEADFARWADDLTQRAGPGGLDVLTSAQVGEAARAGNSLARRAIRERMRELGIGLAVFIVESHRLFEDFGWPDRIVFGGGVSHAEGELFLEAIRGGFADRMARYAGEDYPADLAARLALSKYVAVDETARQMAALFPTADEMQAYRARLREIGLQEIELRSGEVEDLGMVFGHLAIRSSDVPVPLDVLIVPGSPAAMTGEFSDTVAKRYEQFRPGYVVVTGTEGEARFLRETLTARHVPADPETLLVDAEARHSGDNAERSAKLLSEQPTLEHLGHPLRVGLVPAALTSRTIYRFFQSRFAWPGPVEFYMMPPEPTAVTSRMSPAALKSNLEWALQIFEGLATARERGFIKQDGRAEDLPSDLLEAVERLKQLQRRLAVGLEEQATAGRQSRTGLDSQL